MKIVVGLLFLISTLSAFADVNLVLNRANLPAEITGYLTKKLATCSLGLSEETFEITKLDVKKIRVDNGIIDVLYTIELGYTSFRNDVIYNDVTVEVMDSDFSNYKNYEERLSFNVIYDRNQFCK